MKRLICSAIGIAFAASTAAAADEPYLLTIRDHVFSPEELRIPAGSKIKIVVKNEDPTAEEFESYELRREKVVAGHSQITLFVGPLRPGTYAYFGDFHPQTAKGRIIAGERA